MGVNLYRLLDSEVSYQLVVISIDCLPLFKYSLDALGRHLLPNKQKMNGIIREDISRQYI